MIARKAALLVGGSIVLVLLVQLGSLVGIDDLIYGCNFLFSSEDVGDEVVIVGIDASSIQEVGGWPWPRSTLARLFERIDRSGAHTVALDFLFPPRPDREENDSLASVFSRIERLVLPFRVTGISRNRPKAPPRGVEEIGGFGFPVVREPERLEDASLYRAEDIEAPDSLFFAHTFRSGFLNVSTRKATQRLTEVIHVIGAGRHYLPSFGVAAAASLLETSPEDFVVAPGPRIEMSTRRIPLRSGSGSVLLNFRGRRGTIPTVPAAEVLEGSVDRSVLEGKLVLVGMTDAAAAPDFFITPVGADFPGVEIWATSILDILNRSWVRRGGPLSTANGLLALLLFPGLALVVPSRRRRLSAGVSTAVALGSLGAVPVLFHTVSYFWNPLPHLIACVLSLVWPAFRKDDATVVQVGSVDFEPPETAPSDVLEPPEDEDGLKAIPDADTARHVRRRIAAGVEGAPGAEESRVLEAFRELCGGRIIDFVGSGGMADVYLVWKPRQDVYRAVKVIKPDRPEKLRQRFQTEGRILSNLTHPNIVQCYSVGEWHELPYLEMEYVYGFAMDDVIRTCQTLSVEQTLAVGIAVCRALQFAHTRTVSIYGKTYTGIIHRDLKPANILLSRAVRVKIGDFGIARPRQTSLHTGDTGSILGTLPYLAPEQVDGEKVTAQSDIYALGVTLYEMLTGERALPQVQVNALISAKASGKIRPLREYSRVPGDVARVVSTAMAVKPEDRYSSAQAMGKDLERCFRNLSNSTAGYPPLEALLERYREQPAG